MPYCRESRSNARNTSTLQSLVGARNEVIFAMMLADEYPKSKTIGKLLESKVKLFLWFRVDWEMHSLLSWALHFERWEELMLSHPSPVSLIRECWCLKPMKFYTAEGQEKGLFFFFLRRVESSKQPLKVTRWSLPIQSTNWARAQWLNWIYVGRNKKCYFKKTRSYFSFIWIKQLRWSIFDVAFIVLIFWIEPNVAGENGVLIIYELELELQWRHYSSWCRSLIVLNCLQLRSYYSLCLNLSFYWRHYSPYWRFI